MGCFVNGLLSMQKKIFLIVFLISSAFSFSQKIINIDGLYYDPRGNLYSGTYIEHFGDSGWLKVIMPVRNGMAEGEVIYFYENGKQKESRFYSEGILDGVWTEWDTNGVKTAEARYYKGAKNGAWYIWDSEANLRVEMFYNLGRRAGRWIYYDEKGNIISDKIF